MSLLDQAKKEAKRLFNLAKANQEKNQSPETTIPVSKLSSAREIVAVMNGYKNWHDYEEVLKRKDILFDKVDKNTENKEIKYILNNKKYFVQDIEFNIIDNPQQFKKDTKIILKHQHTPITLGHKKDKSFFDNKTKYWELNQYPVLLTGSTGSGRTETLLSLASQYIKNDEGVIYVDGKGDTILYTKMFSYCQQYKRLNDLYCLNFMTPSGHYKGLCLTEPAEKNTTREQISHSIDPLNPMVGNDKYFQYFFGQEMGNLIHAILKKIHEKGQLMDLQSLESILMLNNLMKWQREKRFDDLQELNDYLVLIGLSLEEDNDENDLEDALEKHVLKCSKAYAAINLFKAYDYIFKIDCSVDMMQIFLQRKILVVSLPALEKSSDDLILLGEMINNQIAYAQSKIDLNTHMQNIILDEFIYYCKSVQQFNLSTTKNNYIFGTQGFEYRNEEEFNYVMSRCKTYVAMKLEDPDISSNFKLELMNNLSEMPKEVFGNNGNFMKNLKLNLKDQREGQAIVFSFNQKQNKEDLLLINNEYKYYTQKLNCVYIMCPKPKGTWLIDHPTPIMYIKGK